MQLTKKPHSQKLSLLNIAANSAASGTNQTSAQNRVLLLSCKLVRNLNRVWRVGRKVCSEVCVVKLAGNTMVGNFKICQYEGTIERDP